MVVGEASIDNIMGGIANTGVRLHSYKRKLKQRFDIIKKLGQGTYGKVQLGINKETGQEVAIKTIKKSKIETEADLIRIRREIQIMSSVRHPNIVHIYEVFENREKMVLVMEYAAGGELYDYLSERKVLAEEEARRIFRQIAIACYYCHKHKICHRDLKLENILLDENGNAKIADFGLSNVFDDARLLSTFCGSPLYASPEIVKGTPYHGPEVDCWSLGVLLYTLVYGAMPFDGSNFKRLVKQISQGDYFEPKKPSAASPLIREMLTVSPKDRSDIVSICSHWWVNEGYDESALEISEYLANQTPVRLDYLLSLAPPPPQLESDKLVVTGDIVDEEGAKSEGVAAPTRSQSVGSLMELQHPAEKRIKDLLLGDDPSKPSKRKLEVTASTEQIGSANRKDKIVKENTVADVSVHSTIHEDENRTEGLPLDKSLTQTLTSKDMDVEEGAACAEIVEEAKKKSKGAKIKQLQEIDENPSQENLCTDDKENVERKTDEKVGSKKKVLSDQTNKKDEKTEEVKMEEVVKKEEEPSLETKPLERRRSRIYEQAEKFQNLITANENSKSNVPEKQQQLKKSVVLPGVNVDGYKKQFERKCSLTNTSPPKAAKCSIPKRVSIDKQPPMDNKDKLPEKPRVEEKKCEEKKPEPSEEKVVTDDERKLKNAVNVISSALEKEGTRKSKSRPCIRKPPVPFGVGGRSASGSIGMITTNLDEGLSKQLIQPMARIDSKPIVEDGSKTSSAEITLKSATLPRRKTSKAEIHLNYPQPKPATMEFKTEMAHRIEAPPKLATQRSEAVFPISAAPVLTQRSASVEPETSKPKERIIPISVEKQDENKKQTPSPVKPPTPQPKVLQSQKSYQSRSGSVSRQSTQESDSETTISGAGGEPIRKSPREYIIPIAVEGGGYVTPRAGSLEPSETGSTTNSTGRRSKFSRSTARTMNSLLSDREGSEDESPFGVPRHSSFGRDSDTEESRKDTFPMHRLRSSRPRKLNLDHTADSMSSGEDDDDDGFDILTAENLFSTLLSRVKDLTHRINVDDRPGFPSSRLLSHFDHGTNFWNFKSRLDPFSRSSPLGRAMSHDQSGDQRRPFGAPWRRSVSRDLASDIESVYNDNNRSPATATSTQSSATLPRGDTTDTLNLSDLNLKRLRLSDEDAAALSYLTPGLSRRIQRQLLAQLPPSEAKKITRTMSMRNPTDDSVDRKSSTLNRIRNRDYSLPRTTVRSNSTNSKVSSPAIPEEYNYNSLPKPTNYNSNLDSSCLTKYLSPPKVVPPSENPEVGSSTKLPRRSRFLRPDFYDKPKEENMVIKEKKEREMETQKVLKEIRDKRKSRLSLRREKSQSRDTSKSTSESTGDDSSKINCSDSSFQENGNNPSNTNNQVTIKYKPYVENLYGTVPKLIPKRTPPEETDDLLNNVSASIKTIETNLNSNWNYVDVTPERDEAIVPKKDVKVSKLVRPKSYPTDTLKSSTTAVKKETKIAKPKPKEIKSPSPPIKEVKNKSPPKSSCEKSNKKTSFLHSIEKKIEKLRGLNNNSSSRETSVEKKPKDEKKSNIESAIKKLREQSLPRTTNHCVTESGLIKRAVSVEDIPAVGKELQPSRKSVTKILGLFKKYEEKDKDKTKGSKLKKPVEKVEKEEPERPKSYYDNPLSKIEEVKAKSKLPVNSFRRSLNLDNKPKSTVNNNNGNNNNNGLTSEVNDMNGNDGFKLDRKNLKLDLSATATEIGADPIPSTSSENRNSTATDDSSLFLSPCEDIASCDSWSVCSDYHPHADSNLTSPISINGNIYSGDESSESVIDRIRRKSFYTRFNEKKKPPPRKLSLSNNYRDPDLYGNQRKSCYRSPSDYSSLDRRSVDYRFPSSEHRRPYVRSASLVNDYVNLPHHHHRYQTYNPRLVKHVSSLYSPDIDGGDDAEDDLVSSSATMTATGKSSLNSYHFQPSRPNGRASSVSPSTDNL